LRAARGQSGVHRQHAGLGLRVQAIAALGLNRGHAHGQHLAQEQAAAGVQGVGVRRSRLAHGRVDAAAPAGDLLVAFAPQAGHEVVGAPAGEAQVGVGVDQAGHHQLPLGVPALAIIVAGGQLLLLAHPGDASLAPGDGAAGDGVHRPLPARLAAGDQAPDVAQDRHVRVEHSAASPRGAHRGRFGTLSGFRVRS
jgi:hypothetical protein